MSFKKAFTLIELSIVMIIVGLIIGGILAGQNLIKSSQLRSLIADINYYQIAINTFKLKYSCLPGDCVKATDFLKNTNNGNGNFVIETGIIEEVYVWQHLSLAGIIAGSYTGNYSSPNNFEPNINIPASKIPKVGFALDNSCAYGNCYNALGIAQNLNNSYGFLNGAVLTPFDAQSIDVKTDDGLANLGKIIVLRGGGVKNNNVCVDKPYDTTPTGVLVNYLSNTDETISCRIWYIYDK